MKVPFLRRRGVDRSRGQAMVEFALILPVLAILLVMAIDFGRVYFGWVGLQNVARIGANYAGAHPEGWDPNFSNTAQKAQLQAAYAAQMAQDAANLNCSPLPRVSPVATYIPIPSFIDTNGNGRYEMGEQVSVTLNCAFGLITPLANSVIGGGVNLSALAVFPVRAGAIAGIPVATGGASSSASAVRERQRVVEQLGLGERLRLGHADRLPLPAPDREPDRHADVDEEVPGTSSSRTRRRRSAAPSAGGSGTSATARRPRSPTRSTPTTPTAPTT